MSQPKAEPAPLQDGTKETNVLSQSHFNCIKHRLGYGLPFLLLVAVVVMLTAATAEAAVVVAIVVVDSWVHLESERGW